MIFKYSTSMSRFLSFVGVTGERRGCQSERSCCGTTTGNYPDKDLGMAPVVAKSRGFVHLSSCSSLKVSSGPNIVLFKPVLL